MIYFGILLQRILVFVSVQHFRKIHDMAMYLSNIYYIRGTVYIYEGAPFQGETAIVRLNDPFM